VDWFTALEAPTQVAIIGVVTAVVAAASGVAIAIVNNRRAGGGKAEIAAMTIDSSAVHQVAAAIEGLNLTLIEQNKVGEDICIVVKGLTREIEELRREVRALSDKLRSRS
jgi:ABC-type spermidine/putrescine transport system permease subunit II